MNSKSLLQSKTIWVQVAAIIATFIPAVQGWLSNNPVEFVAVLGALNVLVRFVTSGKVSLFSDSGSASGGTSVLLLCVMGMALGGGLTSCSVLDGLNVVTTSDGCALAGRTSAKGQSYYAGLCIDGRYVARWSAKQADGTMVEARYTRLPDGRNEIEYLSDDTWLGWDDKSGVQIGEVPVNSVETAVPDVYVGAPLVSAETGLVPSADEVPVVEPSK